MGKHQILPLSCNPDPRDARRGGQGLALSFLYPKVFPLSDGYEHSSGLGFSFRHVIVGGQAQSGKTCW